MKNFGLAMLAIILLSIFVPFGIAFAIISAVRYQRTFKKIGNYLSKIFLEIALCIDRLGNAACGDLFNAIMISHGGYHFGVGKETISSALGRNQLRGTLTWAGNGLADLLDWLDEDHCYNSIDESLPI